MGEYNPICIATDYDNAATYKRYFFKFSFKSIEELISLFFDYHVRDACILDTCYLHERASHNSFISTTTNVKLNKSKHVNNENHWRSRAWA